MKQLLYSEWLVLKELQSKTMTLPELYLKTGLDKSLLAQVISNLIKMQQIHATRGIFRARVKITENKSYQSLGKPMIMMINETYRASLKGSVSTSA